MSIKIGTIDLSLGHNPCVVWNKYWYLYAWHLQISVRGYWDYCGSKFPKMGWKHFTNKMTPIGEHWECLHVVCHKELIDKDGKTPLIVRHTYY